jgi:hypothetical protein
VRRIDHRLPALGHQGFVHAAAAVEHDGDFGTAAGALQLGGRLADAGQTEHRRQHGERGRDAPAAQHRIAQPVARQPVDAGVVERVATPRPQRQQGQRQREQPQRRSANSSPPQAARQAARADHSPRHSCQRLPFELRRACAQQRARFHAVDRTVGKESLLRGLEEAFRRSDCSIGISHGARASSGRRL